MPKARVVASTPEYSLWKTTDASGFFCFERLEPASYRVFAAKAGHRTGQLRFTRGKEAEPQSLNIELAQIAGLSGVVLDAEGDPLPGATVNLWTRARGPKGFMPNDETSTETGPDGAFRFTDLDSSTYYLSATNQDEQQRRYVFPFLDAHGQPDRQIVRETFYSGTFSFAHAMPLTLKAGQQITNLVLTVGKSPARRLAGRALAPSPTATLFLEGSTETSSRGFGVIPLRPDGSFERDGLPPANYTLQLKEGDRTIAKQRVDVTAGDAEGIVLEKLQTIDVVMTFRTVDKGPPFRPSPLFAWLIEKDFGEAFPGRPQQDGSLIFRDIVPGIYSWNVSVRDHKLYVKRPGREIDLRASKAGAIEVILSPNVARLEGRVPDADEDTTVILVSGELSIEDRATADENGKFKFEAIAPGKHRLFAIQGFDEDQWGSGELAAELAARSVEIDLKENENRSLTLTAIPAREWDSAVARINR